MKQTIKVKDVCIGEGIPKICAPIIGRTTEEIFLQARRLKEVLPDLVEWRADWYEDVDDISAVLTVLKELAGIIGTMPILFTFRTQREGGEKEIKFKDYFNLNVQVAKSGYIDLVDVELLTEEVETLIKHIKKESISVIVSNHDFQNTPSKEELLSRLQKMDKIGADILKIAVMPNGKKDVLTLLEVTNEMKEFLTKKPMITMAMGKTGEISRIIGEIFGSDVTFGTSGKASAPGQIAISDMRSVLEKIHQINTRN